MTESKQEYESLHAKLEQEIEPRSFVESMYVADIVALIWDIQRLRRCKAGIITNAFNEALQKLLRLHFDFAYPQAEDLAQRWFVDPAAKSEVAKLLRSALLDEFAIEAEAVRASSSDLEVLDRILSAYESRRNKTLRWIEDYRVGFAKTVRESSIGCCRKIASRRLDIAPIKLQPDRGKLAQNRNKPPQRQSQHGSPLLGWQKTRSPQLLSPRLKRKPYVGPLDRKAGRRPGPQVCGKDKK